MKRLLTLSVALALILVALSIPAVAQAQDTGKPVTVELGAAPAKEAKQAQPEAGVEAAWPGPDGFQYTGSSCTINWVDITTTGTPVPGLTDDSYAGPFNVGFTFPFYGVNQTGFYVSSNGFISFGAGSSSLSNQCPLPNSTDPNDIIPIMWDDLYPNYSTGGVYYQSFATCPVGAGACLVVEYYNWAHCCDPNNLSGTWEAILYDNGQIRIQVLDGGSENGSSATLGIEDNNAASDYGLTYACNTASSIVDNLCVEMARVQGPYFGSSSKGAPALARVGERLTYNVAMVNSGTTAGTNVTLVDPIPANTTFAGIVSPPELIYNPTLNQVEWTGTVPQGGTVNAIFEVDVNGGLACPTTIVNTAVISAPNTAGPVTVQASTGIWGAIYYASNFDADDGGLIPGGAGSSWAWGAPTSGPGTAHSGANVWATNPAGAYNNSEDSYIESPLIDLGPATIDPTDPLMLEWWQWLQTESGYDYASVEVRAGGSDWTALYGPIDGSVDLAWAQHAVDISAYIGYSDFQFRFHFTSDGSVTYPGWYVDDVSIRQCTPQQPGLYLGPSELNVSGCNGVPQVHTLSLYNATGAAGTFPMTYSILSGDGTLTGPASVTVPMSQSVAFTVTLTPDLCALPGDLLVARIDTAGNGYTDTATINKTIVTEPSWEAIPASAPSWPGYGYPRDGCTALNAAGQSVTYLFGDTTSIFGFWGYNHDTNAWFQPNPTNTPADRWAPDWAYDPATNLCYVTGGANTPGGGTYTEAYVFDPVANSFTALGSFTSARDFHNSWVGTIDGVKYLCLGGGVNASSVMIQSTQCYDLSQAAPGVWNAENAQMAAFPTDPFGAADGVLHAPGGDQLWYVGGAVNAGASITDEARYWDDADNAWHLAGNTGVPRYRVEGDFFDGAFYQLGGSSGGFTPTTDVVRGAFDGVAWSWTAMPSLNNARMDNVVAIAEGTLWSVDGYGDGPSAYVERLHFCPMCDLQGWLEGTVLDGEMQPGPTCTGAHVTINPGNVRVAVDPATGHYGPVMLIQGEYQVEATAPGYSVETATVQIVDEMTTTQDFILWRPVVDVTPTAPISVQAEPSTTVTVPLTIFNYGHMPLDWEIIEIPGGMAVDAAPKAPAGSYQQPAAATGLDPFILEQIAQSADGKADVFVAFKDTADLSGAYDLKAKADKIQFVRDALRQAADKAQAGVRAWLDAQGIDYKVFYIDNTLLIRADQATIDKLAAFPEVSGLHGNHTYEILPTEMTTEAEEGSEAIIPWDLTIMNIPQVWDELGVTGEGVIVANVDTGVDYDHEALLPNYLCGSGPHADCWLDPDGGSTTPNDNNGHGTGTMSQMAADNNAAFQYAVGGAPDAGWIACLGCPGGSCPDTALNACADWLVMTTPNTPDIVNNSWGTWSALCDPWYDGKIAAYRAAGVVPVWAAGNIGNSCSTSTPPANSIGTLAVGATTSGDVQASFSSTGPGLCTGRTQFPDVSAPGDGTCAAVTGGGYGCDFGGTSFAAPRAAGCLALMKSAAPYLDVQDLMDALMATADDKPNTDCGSPQNDPNYRYGDGRVNCFEAVSAVYSADLPWVWEEPISGTIYEGYQPVDVMFHCTPDQEGLILTGTLRINHNDPCAEPINIPIEMVCGEPTDPDIEVVPPALSSIQLQDEQVVQTLNINNLGTLPLEWNIVEHNPVAGSMPFVPVNVDGQGGKASLTLSSPARALAKVEPVANPEDVLWDQPLSSVNQNAFVNQDFPDVPTYSAFLADDLVNADPWNISTIFVPGNGWNGFSSLSNATGLTWQIYADCAGVPCGDPSGGGNPPVWTLTLAPTDAQVVISTGSGGFPSNTTLSLATPVTLPAGHWWLVFYPTLPFSGGGQYGRQPADTTNGYTGQFINPGGAFGLGTAWQAWTVLDPSMTQTDIAFRLEGTVVQAPPECEPVDIPWVMVDPISGTTGGHGTLPVDVTFDSTGYAAGTYTANLCVESNDPDEPFVIVPLTMTVLALQNIEVTPSSLAQELCPDATATQQLTICNTGDVPLTWSLVEVEPVLGTAAMGDPKPVAPQANADTAPASRAPIGTLALGDLLFEINAEGATGNNLLLGVEYAFGHYWVTGADPGSGTGFLYKLDPTGALVGTYSQAAPCTNWGGRDLAFDGAYLYYGCDNSTIYQVDPATGAPTGVTIPGPISPPRALAYDPATDSFWTASWDSTIYNINRSGGVIGTCSPVGLSTYGFGWDTWSAGGPFLWFWSQDGPDPLLLASQFNPTTCSMTGVTWLGSGVAGEMAGGFAISDEVVPGMAVFVGMNQGNTDRIGVYELGQTFDAPWVSEDPVQGTLPGGECQVIDVTFDSTGLTPGDYFVDLLISSNDPDTPEVIVPVQLTVLESVTIDSVTFTIAGLQVTFDATVSGGAPFTYAWDLGDGYTSALEDPVHTYAQGGCYMVTLTVYNQCGQATWGPTEICVESPNHYFYVPIILKSAPPIPWPPPRK